ncbi:hypothetical protein U1Q18_045317 [Sarracenia purpurea var. burkii]
MFALYNSNLESYRLATENQSLNENLLQILRNCTLSGQPLQYYHNGGILLSPREARFLNKVFGTFRDIRREPWDNFNSEVVASLIDLLISALGGLCSTDQWAKLPRAPSSDQTTQAQEKQGTKAKEPTASNSKGTKAKELEKQDTKADKGREAATEQKPKAKSAKAKPDRSKTRNKTRGSTKNKEQTSAGPDNSAPPREATAKSRCSKARRGPRD